MIVPPKTPPAPNSPQTPSNLICLTIFVTLRPLTQLSPKISATNLQKALNFSFLDNYFPDLSTEAKIWYGRPFKFGLGRFLER